MTRDAGFTDCLLQKFAIDTGTKHAPRPAESWESGQVSEELALNVARIMHSHSVPAALGIAWREEFADVSHATQSQDSLASRARSPAEN